MFTCSCSPKDTTLASEAGDPGSIPGKSTIGASCAKGAPAFGGEAGNRGSIPRRDTIKILFINMQKSEHFQSEVGPIKKEEKEALKKIKDFERRSPYIEDLYFNSGEWADRFKAAREKVPMQWRDRAKRFWLPFFPENWEDKGGLPPELSAYEQEVNKIMADYHQFIDVKTDSQILEKVLEEYNLALNTNPEWAYKIAGSFLDEQSKIKAAKVAVEKELTELRATKDPAEKVKAAVAILQHHEETHLASEEWKEIVECAIEYKELDRYYHNGLNLHTLTYLREKQALPDSEMIYGFVRPMARQTIEGSVHRHEKRPELRATAEHYSALGFLRATEDKDLLDIVFDTTPYEKESDKECQRLEVELDKLECINYGLEEDKEISLENLARFIQDNMPVIENGLRRTQYWHLRRDMFIDDRRGWGELKVNNFEKSKARVYFELDNNITLNFEFRMKNEKAYQTTFRDELQAGRTYFSKDDFIFSDAYYSWRKSGEMKVAKIDSAGSNNELTDQKVAGNKIFPILREIMEPEVDCSQAITVFRSIAKRLQLDKRDTQNMIYAIGQFATHYHSPPITDHDCFAEIGQCLVQPNNFRSFCRKFNLDVDDPHYGDGKSFYHEVNEWQGIIIDWTARQFSEFRTKPYPFIYASDDIKKIGFGKLNS